VPFTLVPGAPGVLYAPQPRGVPVGAPVGVQGPVMMQQPMVYPQPYGVPVAQPYAQPYVLTQRPYVPPKPHDWTTTGFLIGARLGAAVPLGGLSSGGADTGFGLGAEGYFRFAHKWFTGLIVQHDFYKGLGSTLGAADIGFTTNPEGVGFTMDFFAGYRGFSSGPGGGSGEGGIGAGIWIAAGKSLRIIPRIEVSGGSYGNNGGYGVLFGGVTILYNIDIKPKVVVDPAAPAEPSEAVKAQ